MEDKFYDKILDQLIDEAIPIYLENELSNESEKETNVEEVEFSDIHNAKMKKLFKEMKATENRTKMLLVTKKIAVILVAVIAIMTVYVGTVQAWKKKVINFIMQNNSNNYMSISFGEKSGDEELENKESGDAIIDEENGESEPLIVDNIQFLYVPEGFEYEDNRENGTLEYWDFINEELVLFISLKKEKITEIDKFVDLEKVDSKNLTYGDKEVFRMKKENDRMGFVWHDEEYVYNVYSNMETEEEVLKFIDNIRILKKI